ncbi:tachykinin-like peptides receptor 86C [Malaya genurostris]|uniref:tachykinin-like peptides receptor 86C n=1 Tax=Malaya genurostris TaxID=325434 RepID=UPI0026F3938E|nr:tachykinin-like peptides receptor 86C [Malaya genurostris]
MSETVELERLINCTQATLQRYPWSSEFNQTVIGQLNRTEILDVLGEMVTRGRGHSSASGESLTLREFITECLFPTTKSPYELPWQQKMAWGVVFGAMLLVAITGNCIVLWIVLAHRRMRTVTNYFLLNLSVADLLMSSLNCSFNFIFMLNSDWPFGAVYCTINNFMANMSVASSVFTLVAISLDRYIAIVHPLRHRTSRKKARLFLLIIWALSCVLATPCLMYSTVMTKRYNNGNTRTVCYMLWPDGRYPTSMADYIYNLVFLVLTYGIPMLIMIVCYSLMGRELWGSRSIGEHTERQLESMKSKKKVVRMFIIVVTIFAICWLPYHLFFVYAYHNNQMTSSSYVQQLYLGFYWLAMSNAMVNPIIYYWMNSRFRVYFQEIICFCCLQFINSRIKTVGPQGVLLNKNSNNSELGRCRSYRHRSFSVRWRPQYHSAEEFRMRVGADPTQLRNHHLHPHHNHHHLGTGGGAGAGCRSVLSVVNVLDNGNKSQQQQQQQFDPTAAPGMVADITELQALNFIPRLSSSCSQDLASQAGSCSNSRLRGEHSSSSQASHEYS